MPLLPIIIVALLSFLGFFFLLALLFLPFHFLFYSLFNLVTVPFQVLKIAANTRLRKNHALEHATVNVLQERYGIRRVSGMARENGFVMQGQVSSQAVEVAAREGLMRMKNGETHLRVHPKCGTSIMASNFLASITFLFLLWHFQALQLWNIVLAIGLAYLLGPLLGRILQLLFTTSFNVKDMEITGVQMSGAPGIAGGLFGGARGSYLVRTSRAESRGKVFIEPGGTPARRPFD